MPASWVGRTKKRSEKSPRLAQALVRGVFADWRFFSTCAIVHGRPACYIQCMTEERQRVILYGDSLILEGLRPSLQARPNIEICVLDQPLGERLAELRSMCPAALIFDLGAVRPDCPLALLQQPGLRLIGINPETHRALVWSGRQVTAVDVGDLVQVVVENYSGGVLP